MLKKYEDKRRFTKTMYPSITKSLTYQYFLAGDNKQWWERSKKEKNKMPSLTTKLLKEKVLTRRQLDRLHEEWKYNFVKSKKFNKR